MSGGDKKTTITPLSERADFYYHPDDNIDAESQADSIDSIDRYMTVVYNECIIFVECSDFHIPDKDGIGFV